MNLPPDGTVLFFDGICNLCSGVVQFIIKRDKKKLFLFASLQSEAGQAAIADLEAKTVLKPDSFILYHKGEYFIKSSGALRAAKLLGGAWSLLYVAMIVPRFLRDAIYDLVASKRYKWFGKMNECMLPTPELKSRFLS